MGLEADLLDHAYQLFCQEALSHLRGLEAELLQLRQAAPVSRIHSLMRAAHSIKGGSLSLGWQGIAQLAHHLEDSFRALYAASGEIDGVLEELLLQAYDALRIPLVKQIESGAIHPLPIPCETEDIFSALRARLEGAPASALASSAELGVDITEAILSSDVESSLQRLAYLLDNPDGQEVRGEIRVQAEVFMGMGEMLHLPGFVEIAQTTRQALATHPDNYLVIGKLSLADFRAAQAAILAGDRQRGGDPSRGLRRLTQPLSPTQQQLLQQAGHLLGSQPEDLQDLATVLEEVSLLDAPMREAGEGDPAEDPPPQPSSFALLESLFSPDLHPDHPDHRDPLPPPALDSTLSGDFASLDQLWSQALTHNPELGIPPDPLPLPGMSEEFAHLQAIFQTPLPPGHADPSEASQLISPTTDSPPDLSQAVAHLEDLWGSIASPEPLPPPTPAPPLQDPVTYQIFRQETQELLQVLEEGLLNLRQDPQPSQIHNLMRAAHSIKGGSALMGLTEIKTIAHQLENVFQRLYPSQGLWDSELEDLLLKAYDCLRIPLISQLETGSYDGESSLTQAAEVFAQLQLRLGYTLDGEAAPPSAAELGVNVTQVIFGQDVAATLAQWQSALADPHTAASELTSQLKEGLEVFLAIAEMLSLPQFAALAQTCQTALATHPQQVFPIAHLALAQFQIAQAAILQGDLTESTLAISPELLAFCPSNYHPAGLSPSPDPLPSLPPSPSLPPLPSVPQVNQPSLTTAIRVDLSRLERINNQIGELVTHETSLFLQQDYLQQTVHHLQQRLTRFAELSQQVQETMDHLIWHGSQSTPSPRGSVLPQPPEAFSDFDSLQMDSYSQVHSLMQVVLEEMSQVEESLHDLGHFSQQSQHTLKKHRQTLRQVRDDLLWARMLPLADLLQRFPRMIRDLAAQQGKQVNFVVEGGETLVDKGMLEKLYDPLVHLVRNAFDHGIEPSETRQAQGKSPTGLIRIAAYHRGNQTLIEVKDDGRGIDTQKVLQKAIRLNLITPAQADEMKQEAIYDLLFTPGFSTASQVSEISGRGVGLDVVRLHVQSLKGSIQIDSQPAVGTTFTLRLPLTLTIAKLLILGTATSLMAIPLDVLVAILTPSPAQIRSTPDQPPQLLWQNQTIPIYDINQLLPYHYPSLRYERDPISPLSLPSADQPPLLLIGKGSQMIALQVDHLLREQELVIKPLSPLLTPPAYIFGCTTLGDGRLVPVMDGAALVEFCLGSPLPAVVLSQPLPSPINIPTVLVTDDSPTMRQTLTASLQKVGYRVLQARDGQEALDRLEQDPSIQAVICDVEMPLMNGFEFLSLQRRKRHDRHLPIIMLTSRSSPKHRQLAQQLGASAYLTKPFLEQELRSTLAACLSPMS
ncbi:MAG: Hpt domain-containing protein [Cyanobacteriota bacterium]|nr:Hpt domain-containing protein [Cyanobacteriota bacterium]